MAKREHIGGVVADGFSVDVFARWPKLSGRWLFGEFLVKVRVQDDEVDLDEIVEEIRRLLAHVVRKEER